MSKFLLKQFQYRLLFSKIFWAKAPKIGEKAYLTKPISSFT